MSRETEASALFARAVLETRCETCKRGFKTETVPHCPNPECRETPDYRGALRLAAPVTDECITRERVFNRRPAAHPLTGRVWFWQERE